MLRSVSINVILCADEGERANVAGVSSGGDEVSEGRWKKQNSLRVGVIREMKGR